MSNPFNVLADNVRRQGFVHKGSFTGPRPGFGPGEYPYSHCLLGHVIHAEFSRAEKTELRDGLYETIREQFPDRFVTESIAEFNDHPDTTLSDVLMVVEKAGIRYDESA